MKTFYFLRHGEAAHNVGFREYGEIAYFSEEYINSPLTAKGVAQCKEVESVLKEKKTKIDIIFTSPLQRTLETTLNVFGGFDGVPIVALDELREDYHLHPANKRERKDEIERKYPNINVDGISPTDEWYGKPFPSDRFRKLNKILNGTKHAHIAVVSHYGILMEYLRKIGHPQEQIANCQVIKIESKKRLAISKL